MQDLAIQLIAALSAHNWLLLTTLIAGVLLLLAHLPAVDTWMGERSQYVRPLWPVLCAGLAELSTAAATKAAITVALVNWGLVSLVALVGAYSKFLVHAGNISLPSTPVTRAVDAVQKAVTADELADEVLKRLDVIPPAPKVPAIRSIDDAKTEPGKPIG
jgi:hypothetical protein